MAYELQFVQKVEFTHVKIGKGAANGTKQSKLKKVK